MPRSSRAIASAKWIWKRLSGAMSAFSAAGRQEDMPESLAMPAIMTVGYAGLLAGPAVIGFVSQATSLTVAFLALAISLLAVAAGARFVRH